jgi:hypothetical protein
MTDRLTLAHAFESAGIEREAAERVAGVVFDAIRETAATKEDLRGEIAQLRHDLTVRGLFGAVSLFFALLTALHYWPPH